MLMRESTESKGKFQKAYLLMGLRNDLQSSQLGELINGGRKYHDIRAGMRVRLVYG